MPHTSPGWGGGGGLGVSIDRCISLIRANDNSIYVYSFNAILFFYSFHLFKPFIIAESVGEK